MPQSGTQPRGLPPVPDHWENFLLCISFHILLPLLPLGIENWRQDHISVASITLVAAMYAISIGVSSRSKLLFGLSVLVTIVFSVAFGFAADGPSGLEEVKFAGGLSIAFIMVTHVLERYNRHVAEREPFWLFVGGLKR